VALFTKAELTNIGRDLALREPLAKSARTILREEAAQAPVTATFEVFLSHSYLDAMHIRALKRTMESLGFTVYVDWIEDRAMNRSSVTRDTAAWLRRRMDQCGALFFATSPNAGSSKWMPWELGYFDGSNGRVAVLPVLEGDIRTNNFRGQEYLGLYPYVTKDPDERGRTTLWVNEDADTYVSLRDWLSGKEPTSH
jgi:hypothetical protein